ncbi:JmjC-domain-containing protein [Xylona heveae TC161]|uniref:JmjC-domain-containing protein n=1 Tax=Xylona heveae (strain CBS 132557 / TC161) TaxID=1328760 RepID=A0A165A7B3_XYLHT|nr:JmjC-domain-containing protein [Xylona heveae TC161]KZF20056.1 JmjC-domain-containing protein [Xylona heveae TC161]
MPTVSGSASPSSGPGSQRASRIRGHLPVDLSHRRTRSLDQSPNVSADSPSGLSGRDISHLPRAVRELQDFNAPPRSSSSDSRSSSRSRGTPRSKPPTRHRLSKIERELLPYNAEPIKDSEERATSSTSQLDIEDSRMWLTRSAERNLSNIAQGRDIERRKSLNVKKLMREQILPKSRIQRDPNASAAPGVPLTHALDMASDSEDLASGPGNGSWIDDEEGTGIVDDMKSPFVTSVKERASSDHLKVSMDEDHIQGSGLSGLQKKKKLVRAETEKAELLYEEWLEKKERINEILYAPSYQSSTAPSDYEQASLENIPEGIDITMEEGLYVFHPTLKKYQDFPTLLSEIEEIAGREMGVVKVVVPKESSYPGSAGATSSVRSTTSLSKTVDSLVDGILSSADAQGQKLNPFKLDMTIHPNTRYKEQSVYKVSSCPIPDVPAKQWREDIEKHRQVLKDKHCLNVDSASDAWSRTNYTGPSEGEMIESFGDPQEDSVYAMDNDATSDLRSALGCIDPKLAEVAGNSLMKSRSRVSGIHSPYFYVSNRNGTPFGMHVEDFAAYSLNYHHVGAPKKWYVVRPREHQWLEEFIHNFLNPEERLLGSEHLRKPRRPPQCGQFLRHNSLYLPEETLRTIGVCYTRVVQHQGEMVITFPFAYHQGYNTGPNIAEAIGYASERWEIFIREGLYQNCRRSNCKIDPIQMDFSFIKHISGRGLESKMTRRPYKSEKSLGAADGGRRGWATQRNVRRSHHQKNDSQSLFVGQDSSSSSDEAEDMVEHRISENVSNNPDVHSSGVMQTPEQLAAAKRKKASPPGTPPQHIRHRVTPPAGDNGDETEEEVDGSGGTSEQQQQEPTRLANALTGKMDANGLLSHRAPYHSHTSSSSFLGHPDQAHSSQSTLLSLGRSNENYRPLTNQRVTGDGEGYAQKQLLQASSSSSSHPRNDSNATSSAVNMTPSPHVYRN